MFFLFVVVDSQVGGERYRVGRRVVGSKRGTERASTADNSKIQRREGGGFPGFRRLRFGGKGGTRWNTCEVWFGRVAFLIVGGLK